MSNTIKLKRGSGSNPSASDLAVGEVALRTDLGKLFTNLGNSIKDRFDKIAEGSKNIINNFKFGKDGSVDVPDKVAKLAESTDKTNLYELISALGHLARTVAPNKVKISESKAVINNN